MCARGMRVLVRAWGCRCLSTCRHDNSFETPAEGVELFSVVAQMDLLAKTPTWAAIYV